MKDFIIISVIVLVILVGVIVGSSVFISQDDSGIAGFEDTELISEDDQEPDSTNKINPLSPRPVAGVNKHPGIKAKKGPVHQRVHSNTIKKAHPQKVDSAVTLKVDDKPKRDPKYLLIERSQIRGKHTITGHILNLKTNKPIGLVKVSLYTKVGQFIQRVRSNENGRFEMKYVPIKSVDLMISKKDFVKLKIKHYNEEKFKEHLLEKLDPGIKVGGIVMSKKDEQALVDVNVQVYRGSSIVKTGIKTDKQGQFEIKGLPKGKLELVFSKSGYSSGSLLLELKSDDVLNLKAPLEKSSTLQVEVLSDGPFKKIPVLFIYFDDSFKAMQYERSILSQHKNKNIYLVHGIEGNYSHIRVRVEGFVAPEAKPLKLVPGELGTIIFDLSSGWLVQAQVLSDKGEALADVAVRVFETMSIGPRREIVLKGVYKSDKNGNFEVPGVSKGSLEFLVESTVYKRTKKQVVINSDSMPPFEIILSAGSFFDGTVKNKKGAVIEVNEVRFTPVDRNGKFDPKRNRPRFEGSQKVGHFKMSGVVEGFYKISITARKHKALILSAYEVNENKKQDTFTMENGLTITGIMRNADGVGLVDASVWFTRKENKSKFQHKAKTDSNGFYSLESLEAGKMYDVFAQASGYVMLEEKFEVTPENIVNDIVLEQKKSFTGIVYDASTRSPIQRFRIKLLGAIGRGLVQDTNKNFNVTNGQFSMPVSAEKFSIVLSSTGYADIVLKDQTLAGLSDEYYMVRGGSVYFTVKLKDSPAVMKSITLSKLKNISTDRDRKTILTNNFGSVSVQGLTPGHYFYRIRYIKGYANHNGELDIVADEPVKEVVQMIQGFVLKGRLISKSKNTPVRVGEVYLDNHLYPQRPIRRYLNQDGFFEFANVSPGEHRLVLKYGALVNKQFEFEKKISVVVPDKVSRGGIFTMETIEVD